jgi:hypothetical protein
MLSPPPCSRGWDPLQLRSIDALQVARDPVALPSAGVSRVGGACYNEGARLHPLKRRLDAGLRDQEEMRYRSTACEFALETRTDALDLCWQSSGRFVADLVWRWSVICLRQVLANELWHNPFVKNSSDDCVVTGGTVVTRVRGVYVSPTRLL